MIYRVFYIDNDDKMFDGGSDGKTYGCFIFIKRSMKGDKCLLEHELEHVKQFWKLQFLRSKCFKEMYAYKRQYLCQGKRNKSFYINMIIKYCKKKSRLDISKFLG